jgi:phospholipase/lecithinase/hemolysin
MKTLKRMMVALLALLPLATGTTFADTDYGYDRIFVFGASLLDSGNHFAMTGETAHPPFVLMGPSYGVGGHHFSNGRTWVEVMANRMELTDWAKPAFLDSTFGNYAVGYARAREFKFDMLPSLYDQVEAWIDNGYCTGAPMNDTLFVVDSSYIDVLDILQGQDPMVVLTGMTTSIAENIGFLYGCGARNLLIANMPPVEASPIVPNDPTAPSLSALFNYVFLQPAIATIASETDMNISVLDLYQIISGMLAAPEAFGLTNITDSCVSFGVTAGAFCKDRNQHFWWDPLHPTKKVHAFLAVEALAALPVPE